MPRITHLLHIKTGPEIVYNALTTQEGLSGWWTPDVTARPEEGSLATFGFGPDYEKHMNILELRHNMVVRWRCVKGTKEWLDTEISFRLEASDQGTKLLFEHNNWTDWTPMLARCSYDWAMFLRSLRLWCEDEEGTPYPSQG